MLARRLLRRGLAAAALRAPHKTDFRGGELAVLPGLEEAFKRNKADNRWSDHGQFEHEALGREMFRHRTHGTCTSAAILQGSALRALGIPTRFVLTIPIIDASGPDQVELAEKNLTNHKVRNAVFQAALSMGDSFASHTFLEVYVGKRWRRLNYGLRAPITCPTRRS